MRKPRNVTVKGEAQYQTVAVFKYVLSVFKIGVTPEFCKAKAMQSIKFFNS